jgi:hypothetical protein
MADMRLLLPFALACIAAGPLAASEPLSRERLLACVDAEGRVTDPELRHETGWGVIRGLVWRIELEDAWQPGRFQPVDARTTFHSGQRFRIGIEAFSNTFVYVAVADADGSRDVLLPEPGESTPWLVKGQKLLLPPDGTAFRFQPPAGTHTLRLIASPGKLPRQDAESLLTLQNGQEPRAEASRSIAQPGSSAAAPPTHPQTPPPLPLVNGLKAAVDQIHHGTLAKGVTVELVDSAPEGNLVTITSADPSAKPILVHDVAVKQAD